MDPPRMKEPVAEMESPVAFAREAASWRLLLHVKDEAAGKIHVFGIDEGAGSGAQDDVIVGDGEGGGIDDAAPGDFQSAVFQSHGGIVPQAGIAEDDIVFQDEGAAVEGGLSLEIAVAAGHEVGVVSLVEFPAEDDSAIRSVGDAVIIRVLVEREGDVFRRTKISRTGDRIIKANLLSLGGGQLEMVGSVYMNGVGNAVYHGEGAVIVLSERSPGHVAAEEHVMRECQKAAGIVGSDPLQVNGLHRR